METALGILGFAALFVAFGIFRPGAHRGCGGDCGGTCSADPSGCDAARRETSPVSGTFGKKES